MQIMGNVLLSIIIPAYNAEKRIEACIQSILEQEYKDFEAIIVDDGSVDETVARIRRIVGGDSRFKLICQQNQGTGSARNTGIDSAKGKYVTFVDSDDEMKHDCVKKVVEMINTNNDADMFVWGHERVYTDEDKLEICLPKAVGTMSGKEYLQYILEECGGGAGPVWCRAYRKEWLNDNQIRFGYYKTAEDGHFNTKCLQFINKAVLANYVGYSYIKEDYLKHSRTLFFNRPRFFQSSVEVTQGRLMMLENAINVHRLEDKYKCLYINQRWKSFESINMQNAIYNTNYIDGYRVHKLIAECLITSQMEGNYAKQYEDELVKKVINKGVCTGWDLFVWNIKRRGIVKGHLTYILAGVIFSKDGKAGMFLRKLLKRESA